MTRTIVVEHLGRIEGHAGITVTLEDERVERVQFDVFEGIRLFEGLVHGHAIDEIPAIVSRICSICSHSHVVTALQALERAIGIEVSAQTDRLRELGFHGTAIESHSLHLFCLALPDFMHRASVVELAAVAPETVAMALRLKKLGNTIQEIVGGRAVHPVNFALGGFGRLPSHDDLLRLRAALTAGLDDCSRAVDVIGGLDIPALDTEPIRCAAVVPREGSYFFGDAVRLTDRPLLSVDQYRSLTNEHCVPHSTAKHSLESGRPYMVGALPRLLLNGDRIRGRARAAWQALGPAVPCRNVLMNDVAQLIEIVFSVETALGIVDGLLDDGLSPEPLPRLEPRAGRGAAASEVPRGILFHSYEVDDRGRIAAADVITPTAQNCAHLEQQFRAAVAAAPDASDAELGQRLEIIARAYDPCVSCSVHVIRKGSASRGGGRVA
jgi:sulfhydrogenase subunit alpha